jgi:hypothetical protein
MTRRDNCGNKSAQVAGGWRASLAGVLKERNGARHDGAVASYATQDKRADINDGPGRIRTYDQGIHFAPTFPPGVDYLFTRADGSSVRVRDALACH